MLRCDTPLHPFIIFFSTNTAMRCTFTTILCYYKQPQRGVAFVEINKQRVLKVHRTVAFYNKQKFCLR